MAVSAYKENILHLINGQLVPTFVKQSQLDYLSDFELFPDDTWVVSYPRSGSTWTQQIVRLILTKGEGTNRVDYAIPWLESTNVVHNISSLERPRGFRSHMPYDRMPCGQPSGTHCKYIAVVRNPKDVAVSFYHHCNNLYYTRNVCWDEFLSWFLKGDVIYGDYFDHVLGWWKHRKDENVLLLKYEDMKKDLQSVIIQIAQFMGHELSQDVVEKTTEKSSFAYMKGNSSVNYEWRSSKFENTYIRKGFVGGWKDYFTPEQSAHFDAIYAQKLMPEGLELNFE